MISWSQYWSRWISVTFYRSYLQAAAGAAFLPQNEADLQMMLNVFLLRKAIYELGYELNNRPEWVQVPLQGILELLNEQNIPGPTAKETTVKETN
jgi:maltose alpha-D-glucosyltransferase/alpha-amylase